MLKRGLVLAFLFLIILTVSAPWATSQQEGEVPAYNAGPPPKGTKLPPILTKDQLWGDNAQFSYQTRAYELAAKIPTGGLWADAALWHLVPTLPGSSRSRYPCLARCAKIIASPYHSG